MILSEKDAKKKWCPYVRLKAEGVCSEHSYNRIAGEDYIHYKFEGVSCIASECVLWEWALKPGFTTESEKSKGEGRCGLIRKII